MPSALLGKAKCPSDVNPDLAQNQLTCLGISLVVVVLDFVESTSDVGRNRSSKPCSFHFAMESTYPERPICKFRIILSKNQSRINKGSWKGSYKIKGKCKGTRNHVRNVIW
ncbi:unnamed protein product [Cuscuta epithymum]|uniref:Uncharacterized protein n=1 Tax=Cuscuta epithymum TaxID=186058 RepID=A0AAV0GJZ3_9ASTE|nr:unnamed protein product [Cuscuta epithymum]